MKTAIVLGATGLTGGIILRKLLKDDQFGTIKIFSRRSVGFNNGKIQENITDLLDLENHRKDFTADEVYCCVGSTKSKTPDRDLYKKIDYGIPLTAAKLCKENDISRFLVISAMGADPQSKIFYSRTKGEMERDVLKELPRSYIFKPALIMGKRRETRILEFIGKNLMTLGDYFLLGPIKRYKSVHAEEIADAMIYVADRGYSTRRIPSDEIRQIAVTSKKYTNARSGA